MSNLLCDEFIVSHVCFIILPMYYAVFQSTRAVSSVECRVEFE